MLSSLIIAGFFIAFICSFKYFMQRLLVIDAGAFRPHHPSQPHPANE